MILMCPYVIIPVENKRGIRKQVWIIVHIFLGLHSFFANRFIITLIISTKIDAIKKYITNKTKGLYKIISIMINAAIAMGIARRSQDLLIFESNLLVILFIRLYR